jgi:ATP-binding cassette subfamily B protein
MEITFSDVSFHFNDQKPVLQNLNFNIPANSITVINGVLGAGKSLLLNIIIGFYEPTSGTILFDKIPLKNLNKESFRDASGIYLEDMAIIKGSLLDNILLGREDVGTDDIVELTRRWGIEDLSSQFTEGLLTQLSETDTELSFSARKKILLLRAAVGKKRLLLLEDPIAGMNRQFSAKMIAYLQEIQQHTTIIIVSQNEDLIAIADQTLFLNKGRISKES